MLTPSIDDLVANRPPRIDFGSATQRVAHTPLSDRQLYYHLVGVDEHPHLRPMAHDRIQQGLAAAASAPSIGLPPTWDAPAIARWARDRASARRSSPAPEGRARQIELLEQLAPAALIDGAWLQNVSNAVTSHTAIACRLLPIHARRVGAGEPSRHRGNLFDDTMRALGVHLPEPSTWLFAARPSISDAAFAGPAFELALACYPRTFLPELLGYTLHRVSAPLHPVAHALHAALLARGLPRRFFDEWAAPGDVEAALGAIEAYFDAVSDRPALAARAWARVSRGVAAGARFEALLAAELHARAEARPSLRARMIEMLRFKAPHARGYHSYAVLGHQPIDDYLDPDDPDYAGLLDALADSAFVQRGNAAESALFTDLLAFTGPMFRIFSPEEMGLMRAWVDSLPPRRSPTSSRADAPPPVPAMTAEGPAPVGPDPEVVAHYARLPIGEQFHFLANIEQHPDVLDYALALTERWLSVHRRDLVEGDEPIPFERYSHAALAEWLDARHAQQVASYVPLRGAPEVPREYVIGLVNEYAPQSLVDGAWVQTMGNASLARSAIGSMLFNIYDDEVGNGDPWINHPNVYRRLLAGIGIEVPPVDSLAFARFEHFTPASYRVPVFWMSISQFPRRYLAEILGLNLAMELSGTGGDYRTMADWLEHYGFERVFLDLHNSIDNVSTGHTAWAREAIQLHLDDMFRAGGRALMDEHWRRVWVGFRSLAPPEGVFAEAAPRRPSA